MTSEGGLVVGILYYRGAEEIAQLAKALGW